MASFGGDIDLLAGTIGSQLIAIKNDKGQDVQGVFVPLSYNQMKVYQDKNGKNHATIAFNMWPASQGIVNFWKSRRLQAGEEISAYSIPSHRLELNLTQEYRQKLLERAKAVVLEQHKDDWTTPEQQDEKQNKELRNLMYSYLPSDLCTSVWMHQPKMQPGGSAAPAAVAPATTTAATAWTPNFGADGNMSGGANIPDNSDLPF